MSKEFEEIVLRKLEVLEETTQNTAERLGVLEETTQKMQKENAKKFGEIEIELRDTREIVKSLSENFARFDYEINKKIDTLFDAYTVNKEKNEVHEGDIVSLNEKVFNHDIRISNLEDKILTA